MVNTRLVKNSTNGYLCYYRYRVHRYCDIFLKDWQLYALRETPKQEEKI